MAAIEPAKTVPYGTSNSRMPVEAVRGGRVREPQVRLEARLVPRGTTSAPDGPGHGTGAPAPRRAH